MKQKNNLLVKNGSRTKKVFIIAEIGNNHEGSFKIAKKLVNLAAKAGVDAVKFQTFKVEEFVNKSDKKRFKTLKKFQLTYQEFQKLKKIANKKKLFFISTPLDIQSANFLKKNSDFIKIASSDNNFFPLLDNLIQSEKKIILSTGMTSFEQIKIIISYLEQKIGKKKLINKLSLMHCVSSYPVKDVNANLKSIPFLIDNTDLNIGYSDHTIGSTGCLGAVALGAKIIEKHFTLDKKFSNFRDHSISADFTELKEIVINIRKLEKQLGRVQKLITKSEKILLKKVRRSAFSRHPIKKNEILTLKNIKFLRDQRNKNFLNLKDFVGKKSKKNLSSNSIINKIDIF